MNKMLKFSLYLFAAILASILINLSGSNSNKAYAASCGVNTGSEHSYAGSIITTVYLDANGREQPTKGVNVRVYTSKGDGMGSSGYKNIVRLSGSTVLERVQQMIFKPLLSGCDGPDLSKGNVVVLGYGTTSQPLSGAGGVWAIDCDVSHHSDYYNEFSYYAANDPTNAPAGGTWTSVENAPGPNGETRSFKLVYKPPNNGWEVEPSTYIKGADGVWSSTDISVKPEETITFSNYITNKGPGKITGGFTATSKWSGNKTGVVASVPKKSGDEMAPGAAGRFWVPAMESNRFKIPPDAKKGWKYCQNVTSNIHKSTDASPTSVSSKVVCAIVGDKPNGWYQVASCTASKAIYNKGDNVTFTYYMSNPSNFDAPKTNWSTSNSFGKNISGSVTLLKGTSGKKVGSVTYTVPNYSTPNSLTAKMTFASSQGKTSTIDCTATLNGTPPPDGGNGTGAMTEYKGVEPKLPGEVANWVHKPRDTTYPCLDPKPRTGQSNYSLNPNAFDAYLNKDFHHHIELRFFHETTANNKIFEVGGITKSSNPIEHSSATCPDGTKLVYNGSRPKIFEEDISKKYMQHFEFDVFSHRYDKTYWDECLQWSPPSTGTNPDGSTYYIPPQCLRSERRWYMFELPPTKRHTTKGNADQYVEVGKRPKIQFWGGDVRTRGQVSGSVMTPWIHDKNDRTAFGSWAEYGIFANSGVNQLLSSANFKDGLNGTINSYNNHTLTFANTGSYGNFASVPPRAMDVFTQFANRQPTDTSTSINLSQQDAYKYYNVGGSSVSLGGSVGLGSSIVVKTTGTVTINSNIDYQSTSDPARIPGLVIIANNINIAPNVTNVDAWLMASGTVNTCDGITDQRSQLTLSTCTSKLRINGPISAGTLMLNRTYGSEKGTTNEPAEVINLRGDAYIWARKFQSSTGKLNTVDTRELPPRY